MFDEEKLEQIQTDLQREESWRFIQYRISKKQHKNRKQGKK